MTGLTSDGGFVSGLTSIRNGLQIFDNSPVECRGVRQRHLHFAASTGVLHAAVLACEAGAGNLADQLRLISRGLCATRNCLNPHSDLLSPH